MAGRTKPPARQGDEVLLDAFWLHCNPTCHPRQGPAKGCRPKILVEKIRFVSVPEAMGAPFDSPDIHPRFILVSQNVIMLAMPRNWAEGG